MSFLRRTLGISVMIAGILGLALSVAGLAAVWIIKPTAASFAGTTIDTLSISISTSQEVMSITEQALGATIDSVDALSTMLDATAASVEETQPMLDQINLIMGQTLPATLTSATTSLKTAQQAAGVLDGAIKSLDTFRFVLSATPLIGAFVEQPAEPYNPEVPLADSLGQVASDLESLPDSFTEMSASLDSADDNLVAIQNSLVTMADSVALISTSLSNYQGMIKQSKASMASLKALLDSLQKNLDNILNWTAIGLSAFFLWLLTAQIVIFSQGWELYRGTANSIESGPEQTEAESE